MHSTAFSVQDIFSLCDFCIHFWHSRRDGLWKILRISLMEWVQPNVGSHCTAWLSRNSRFLPWNYCCLCLSPLNDTSYCVVGINSLVFLGLWWMHWWQCIHSAHTKLSSHSFWREGKPPWSFFPLWTPKRAVRRWKALGTHQGLLLPDPTLGTVYSTGLKSELQVQIKHLQYNYTLREKNIFLPTAQQCEAAGEGR